MGHLSPNISGHIALYGSRLLHSQEDLWKTTTRSYGRLGCDFGYLVNIHEDDLRAAVHLGKDYDMNLRFVKNYLWKTTGQLFSETEKLISGQTETIGKSMINFQDLRWVDKLIAQPSLSICHCQSLRLLRFCPPNSLTYTVASSCVCTSPLAVMTIVGLHDFVKVSISAEFKSFLLIMCIDAPESTTNSRSSGSRFDGAGRHQFSEGEKNAALFFSFYFLRCF